MKYAIIIITILAFAFATTLDYGGALRCYFCVYSGTGDDTTNCKTPNSKTATADSILAEKCKVCAKLINGTVIARACAPSSTETKCKTEDKVTACVCDTDLCNVAMNARPVFSAAATLAFTAAVALLYKNFL